VLRSYRNLVVSTKDSEVRRKQGMAARHRLAQCVLAGVTSLIAVLAVAVLPAEAARGTRSFDGALSRGPGVVNHPVGVRPSRNARVPKGWPVEADGTRPQGFCNS